MTNYLIKKSHLKGEIRIPPSKSQTLRAILFGSLGSGKTLVHNPLDSPDTLSMIRACKMTGAGIEIHSRHIEIQGVKGKITFAEDVIDAGNSGIVLRFFTAIAGLGTFPFVITGDESIRHQRPMKELLQALSQLGARYETGRGDSYAPIILTGPLHPGVCRVNGEDSQHVSALLIAASFVSGVTEIHVENPGEKPWVAMTLDWFDRLGIPYENHAFAYYKVTGPTKYSGFDYTVPGDFSSAAFPIAAAIITRSELCIKNLDMNDIQGDKFLISIFRQMGARIEIDASRSCIHVRKSDHLKGITVDINQCIDGITILAVLACYAEGETIIINAAGARDKECNRIHCIAKELRKMGADIVETPDGLRIIGSPLSGAIVHSHRDHRMAMSLVVAGLGCEGETTVTSVDCIAKTFPSFFEEFIGFGANIRITDGE